MYSLNIGVELFESSAYSIALCRLAVIAGLSWIVLSKSMTSTPTLLFKFSGTDRFSW